MQIFSNILSLAKKVALFACILVTLAVVARVQPDGSGSRPSQIAVINLIQVQDDASESFSASGWFKSLGF